MSENNGGNPPAESGVVILTPAEAQIVYQVLAQSTFGGGILATVLRLRDKCCRLLPREEWLPEDQQRAAEEREEA